MTVGQGSANKSHWGRRTRLERSGWLGFLFKSRRRALGLTFAKMSSRTGFSTGTLFRLESGLYLPHRRTLRTLARGYELPFRLVRTIRDSPLFKQRAIRLRREIGRARKDLRAAVLGDRIFLKRKRHALGLLRKMSTIVDYL